VTKHGRSIPISAPTLGGREAEYVLDCLGSTWVSSRGPYIEKFERAFADICGSKYAVACNTGTAALHLALLALGIGPGNEVIVPTLTYVASANAVRYCGATVVFADCEPDTWTIDPEDVARKIGARTKAVMAVHLYGQPADMRRLLGLAKEHDVAIVEDAAEAHGARVWGRPVGAAGTIGAFSFYGNKIVTTGEGGMVVTDDPELAERSRLLKGQGQAFDRTFWHPVIGYNYRMTNIEAAIGLAQLERLDENLARRRDIATRYRGNLSTIEGIGLQGSTEETESANWLVGVTLPVRSAAERDRVSARLAESGIETRPFFYPVHTMPPYATDDPGMLRISEDLSQRGICLPTWAGLTDEDVDRVCDHLSRVLEEA
jgi:perosamine synthetase